MTNTKEKVVWITGASSGIGKAMAFEWARLGYKVVLSARRKELLEEIALEIKNSGGETLVVRYCSGQCWIWCFWKYR